VFRDPASGPMDLTSATPAGIVNDLLTSLTFCRGCSSQTRLLAIARSTLAATWAGRCVRLGVRVRRLVQFFFFEEYDARYNHLALDYLAYPHEVLGNIFASYNVPLCAALAAIIGTTLMVATRHLRSQTRQTWGPPIAHGPSRSRPRSRCR
jgi:hypothetical protein